MMSESRKSSRQQQRPLAPKGTILEKLQDIYPDSNIPNLVIEPFYELCEHHKKPRDVDWDILRDLNRNALYSQQLDEAAQIPRVEERQIVIMWDMIFHVYNPNTGISYVQGDLDLFGYLILSQRQDIVLKQNLNIGEWLALVGDTDTDEYPWIFYLFFRDHQWKFHGLQWIGHLYLLWRRIVDMQHLLRPERTPLDVFKSIFEDNKTIYDVKTKLLKIVREGYQYYEKIRNDNTNRLYQKLFSLFDSDTGMLMKTVILPTSHLALHESSVSHVMMMSILIICLL